MAKTAEKNLWASMRTAMKDLEPHIHYTRIENSISDSFPDVEVQFEMPPEHSFAASIELKTAARPKRETTGVAVKVRPGQVRWLQKRWKVGGSSWILLQVGSGRDLARYLIPGELAKEVSEGQTETWLAKNSASVPKAPLADIVTLACTARSIAPWAN